MTLDETMAPVWQEALTALHAAESRFEEATGCYVDVAALDVALAQARLRAIKIEWVTARYQASVCAWEAAAVRAEADPGDEVARFRREAAAAAVRQARAALEILQATGSLADALAEGDA